MSDDTSQTTSAATTTADTTAATTSTAATTAVSSPWYTELYDTTGKLNHAAFDKAPDHIKAQKDYFTRYPTIEDVFFGSGNAFANIGKKALAPLPDSATDAMKAERKAHLDMINGVPVDIKGYGLKRPDNVPEGNWSDEAADKLAATLQKYSGSPALGHELLGIQASLVEKSIQQQKQQEQAFMTGEDTTFKTAIQNQNLPLDRANELTMRGAALLGIDPKSPILVTAEGRLACLKAQQMTAESKFIGDKQSEGNQGSDERQQALDITSNPENPKHAAYRNPQHPMYKQVNEEVDRLYAAWGAKGGARR